MPRFYRHCLLPFGLLTASLSARAQTAPPRYDRAFQAWYNYTGDHQLTDFWGVHSEAQLRRADLLPRRQQLLLRLGLNQHWSDRLQTAAGYTLLRTYPYGEFPEGHSREHRSYQEVQLADTLGRLALGHRFRLEQRWVRAQGEAGPTFSNRARYQFSVQLPLQGRRVEPKEWYLAAYDEVFVGFGRHVDQPFNQNRLYGALGRQFSRAAAAELGYMYHVKAHDDGRTFERNHTLYVALTYDLDLRGK
ncbi:DUF2490 domain-containing protein [Hymenobacter sp. 15J16-1T3B]|uniref:DUF2490 domain-containing protein n=1 Tax=Hymenobacter sp. 15J16-1T3B TaxID=2886941 RepID=UPI001D0FE447|nr:DUF2490 domain-containing protein [Hymenobacter sp. 15J16-1T3B]MCC3157589.1 DUF2490 domain-containing protein [Hymenobacter sp. 15J16-1T3B]